MNNNRHLSSQQVWTGRTISAGTDLIALVLIKKEQVNQQQTRAEKHDQYHFHHVFRLSFDAIDRPAGNALLNKAADVVERFFYRRCTRNHRLLIGVSHDNEHRRTFITRP